MKKSILRKLIRETIIKLLPEQKRGGSGTCFATTTVDTSERPIKEQGFNDYHTWEVCSMSASGTIVTASWTGAFSFAALGPTSGAGITGPTGTLNAFYAWVVGQIGAINVGDSFTFEMTNSGMCNWLGHNNIDSVCFKYLGIMPLFMGSMWNGTVANGINDNCCSTPVVPDDKPIPPKCCDWCNTQTGNSTPPSGCFDWMCDECSPDSNGPGPIIP